MPGILLETLRGKVTPQRPVWFMRQAGRYLPEYRELRVQKGGFLQLATDPEAAAEVTLQPLRRFGFDGAILFSDILMVPWALGQDLTFGPGEGPQLSPPANTRDAIALLGTDDAHGRLQPIYQTVARVAAAKPVSSTLLGFAGSPWTVATYMIAGRGSKDHAEARLLAYRDPAAMDALIDRIVTLTVDYLANQIAAGAEAVQLFDSWAGSLSPSQFQQWVIGPNARITAQLHARCPGVPVIGFPKGAGAKLLAYADETGVDAVGLDETVDPHWAHRELPAGMPMQGNLDPQLLLAGGPELDRATLAILDAFAGRPHVFNLGHGIDKETPVEHVHRVLDIVRNWRG